MRWTYWFLVELGAPMIVTEHGLTCARAGDTWRRVEYPTALIVRGDRYRIEGNVRELPTLAAARAALIESEVRQPEPGAARPMWGSSSEYVSQTEAGVLHGIRYLA